MWKELYEIIRIVERFTIRILICKGVNFMAILETYNLKKIYGSGENEVHALE